MNKKWWGCFPDMAPEGGGELLMFHRHTQLEFVNIQFKIEALDNSICFSHITQITKKNKESKKKNRRRRGDLLRFWFEISNWNIIVIANRLSWKLMIEKYGNRMGHSREMGGREGGQSIVVRR